MYFKANSSLGIPFSLIVSSMLKQESSLFTNNSSGNNSSTAKILASISSFSVENRVCFFRKEVLISLAHKLNDLHELKKLISTFDGLEYKILYKKHVEGMTLEEIANKLNYNTNYIRIKHANIMRMKRYAEKVTSKKVT